MTKEYNVTKGEIFVFTSGEYSDYSYNGMFRALQDFNIKVIENKWMEEIGISEQIIEDCGHYKSIHSIMSEMGNIDKYESLDAYMSRMNYIEDVDYKSFHTGNYGWTGVS